MRPEVSPLVAAAKASSAARQLDALNTDDPEHAHGNADDILLANVHPVVAAAYLRLVDRAKWWACA